ncbi:hypothetical protein V8C35DRAFT_308734 [Trichoderma chlorosporum]
MPPFEAPRLRRISQFHAWSDNVEPQMQDLLWGDYWQRFNTIQIPILRKSDYFDNAMEIAKLAHGQKAEFERIFEERNQKRREELLRSLAKAATQTIYNDKIFPCEDARRTVFNVCQTGCLWDFLRLLNGNAFGWEADVAEDVQPDGAVSNPQQETQILGDETQYLDDDYYYEDPMEDQTRGEQSVNAAYYIGTYTSVLASGMPVLEKEDKEKGDREKRKRDQFDDDTSASSAPYASNQQPTDGSATDNNSAIHAGYKRRKPEKPFMLDPASVNSSSQLAADKGISKERSRSDDS